MAINVPAEGRPTEPTNPNTLVGTDGNAFSIMGKTSRILRKAGASQSFVDAYLAEATSGNYDHLLAASVAYLSASQDSD